MKKNQTEIVKGKEVFKNNKFSQYPTLNTIITTNQAELNNLISIRIGWSKGREMEQYNIETKKYITNFFHHNGLDLLLTQYNKAEDSINTYTPYANPGYNIFVNRLISYYEQFGKRPTLDFAEVNIERRNDIIQSRWGEIPLSNYMSNVWFDHWVWWYLENKEWFVTDPDGTYRQSAHTEPNREWLWFTKDESIIKVSTYNILWREDEETPIKTIKVENELLPLYLQAFIDTMNAMGGSTGNLKRLYDITYHILEHPEMTEDEKSMYKITRNKKPLTKE